MLGQYVEPVQLQVVCYQLWENIKRRAFRPISRANLKRAGDVDRALHEMQAKHIRIVAESQVFERNTQARRR